jgi:hypothetical protein
VVRAAKLIAAMRPALDAAVREALMHIPRADEPLSNLTPRVEFSSCISLPDTLLPIEKLKTTTLAEIAAAPCFIGNTHAFRAQLEALMKAPTLSDAARERKNLIAEAEASHRRVFVESLEQACAKAASAAGFGQVERSTGPLGDRRIIATDEQGRGIVTEIGTDRRGDVALASEIIGVKDNSCHKLMARFEEELERLGVEAGPPERRATHGAAQLSAAKEFLRKKVDTAVRRAQRLNQRLHGRVAQ